ncbi:MAG: GNAT family N-acetyltransferase [Oscillospiraceae bacterium]|nr:GNAT family N-acetyltransferase [Oscillospiraceae bacterium]
MREDFYIREVCESELEKCAEVIRQSFLTVAKQFGLTEQNCPKHRAFIKTERLVSEKNFGIMQFGLFITNKTKNGDVIIGFAALQKLEENIYELKMLSVLPEFRHNGYGHALVDFAKCKVKELYGQKITIGIVEENEILKNWYISNGFTQTGTKFFPDNPKPFTVGFMEAII